MFLFLRMGIPFKYKAAKIGRTFTSANFQHTQKKETKKLFRPSYNTENSRNTGQTA